MFPHVRWLGPRNLETDLFGGPSTKCREQWICKCADAYLREEVCIGKGDALDLHKLSCFSVPSAPSIAKTVCKEGDAPASSVWGSRAVSQGSVSRMFWKRDPLLASHLWDSELSSGRFLWVRACQLPVLWAAGINTILPLPSDKLTAFCN